MGLPCLLVLIGLSRVIVTSSGFHFMSSGFIFCNSEPLQAVVSAMSMAVLVVVCFSVRSSFSPSDAQWSRTLFTSQVSAYLALGGLSLNTPDMSLLMSG